MKKNPVIAGFLLLAQLLGTGCAVNASAPRAEMGMKPSAGNFQAARYTQFSGAPAPTATLVPPAAAPGLPALGRTLTAPPIIAASPSPSLPWLPTAQPLPVEHFITNVPGHHQLLALDCETAAAVDWAAYFGVKIDELEFQRSLPISDNPDYGFAGNVNGVWGKVPPDGYGVYAGPVADELNSYGLSAKAYKNYTFTQLEADLARNVPVIAWVTGNVEPGIPQTYRDALGRSVVVAPFEHVILITGYSETYIRYLSEGVPQFASIKRFLASWGVLGNMVVVDR